MSEAFDALEAAERGLAGEEFGGTCVHPLCCDGAMVDTVYQTVFFPDSYLCVCASCFIDLYVKITTISRSLLLRSFRALHHRTQWVRVHCELPSLLKHVSFW